MTHSLPFFLGAGVNFEDTDGGCQKFTCSRSFSVRLASYLVYADVQFSFSDDASHCKRYIVRAAFPNLVLRELLGRPKDGADPKQVAVGLRWYEGKYCDRDGRSPETPAT